VLALLLLELVSIETRVEPESCYLQQPVVVTLFIRYDEEVLRERGVQLFARALELPVKVEAPWLDGLDGTEMRPPDPASGPSLALNDDIVEAERVEGGVALRRVFRPARTGELVIPPARLLYATATKFRDDFVHGRVPLDREDHAVETGPRTLQVLPLPDEGKPPGFDGAVGRFVLHAAAPGGAVRPMESFPLELRIEGTGNLDAFPPPRLELEGIHVFGRTDHGGDPRRITYDVAVKDASVAAIPPIVLWAFDPGARAYRAARTAPIPIEVVGTPPPAKPARRWWVAALVVLGAAVLLAVLRLRRRREPDPVEQAALAFLADGSFARYLATLLGCPEAAVIAPDLGARLEARGVPRELAARAAALLDARVAARYGGPEAAASEERYREEARAIVDAISASRRGAPGS